MSLSEDRCTLECLVTINGRLTEYQKEAVKGCVLAPVMKYCSFAMERNLALALVKAWVPRKRAFRLGERLVPFSVVDVVLITGMPATRKRVEFEEENVTTDFGDLVRERVHEVEQQQLRTRRVGVEQRIIASTRTLLLRWCTYANVIVARNNFRCG